MTAVGSEGFISQLEKDIPNCKSIDKYYETEKAKLHQFINFYKEKYDLKETKKAEFDRLKALSSFVDQDKINEYLAPWFDRTLKKLGFKRYFNITDAMKASTIKDIVDEEKKAFDQDDSNYFENHAPIIIHEQEDQRLHQKGFYIRAFDQFGNTYIAPPDGVDYEFIDILTPYFNIYQYSKVQRFNYKGELAKDKMIRYLAEHSRTIDQNNISQESLTAIDPMPVKNPDKSFLGCVLINLLSGAVDCVVEPGGNGHNYYMRKDGTFYIFDLPGSSYLEVGEGWQKKQVKVLETFIDNVPDVEKEEIFDYISDTIKLIFSLAVDSKEYSSITGRTFYSFPTRISSMMNLSNFNSNYREKILNRLRKGIEFENEDQNQI